MKPRSMRGVYVVEFTLISGFLFVLLLGVLEMGRFYFTVNALDESVRRGARLAAVCDPTTSLEQDKILRRAIFNAIDDDGDSSLVSGLQKSNIRLSYLNGSGGVVTAGGQVPLANYGNIRFVRASVSNYQYNQVFFGVIAGVLNFIGNMFGFESGFDGTITLPAFQSTIPRESLGRHAEEGVAPEITPC